MMFNRDNVILHWKTLWEPSSTRPWKKWGSMANLTHRCMEESNTIMSKSSARMWFQESSRQTLTKSNTQNRPLRRTWSTKHRTNNLQNMMENHCKIVAKNCSKVHNKSIENHLKINQKSFKNHPWGCVGAAGDRLGASSELGPRL